MRNLKYISLPRKKYYVNKHAINLWNTLPLDVVIAHKDSFQPFPPTDAYMQQRSTVYTCGLGRNKLKGIEEIFGGNVHHRLQAVMTICNPLVLEVAFLWMLDVRESQQDTGIKLSWEQPEASGEPLWNIEG